MGRRERNDLRADARDVIAAHNEVRDHILRILILGVLRESRSGEWDLVPFLPNGDACPRGYVRAVAHYGETIEFMVIRDEDVDVGRLCHRSRQEATRTRA
jgi:hypothetical protein